MAKIVIEIECGEKTCEKCRYPRNVAGSGWCNSGAYCELYNKDLLRTHEEYNGKYFWRLTECLAAEGEIARLEEIEKEQRQWNDADCNDCPLSSWETCDEICQSKKTLIEKIAELAALDGKSVLIGRSIAEIMLRKVRQEIENDIDDPRMGGRAPAYLYDLRDVLQTALSEGE